MASGVLEEAEAGIFVSTLAGLDTTQARAVVDRLLPAAPGLAFGVLRARVEKAASDTDPAWAEARRAAAVARRRVALRTAPSGALDLCGLDLPEEPALDAHDRIVALARLIARRLRRAGLDAPTGPIQSEVMLTLTGPAGAGMWDRDVIEHVTQRFGGPTTTDDDPGNPDDEGPDDDGPDDRTTHPMTTDPARAAAATDLTTGQRSTGRRAGRSTTHRATAITATRRSATIHGSPPEPPIPRRRSRGGWRSCPGSRSVPGWPPCSASTATPGRSPAAARSPTPSPCRWPGTTPTAPSGSCSTPPTATSSTS